MKFQRYVAVLLSTTVWTFAVHTASVFAADAVQIDGDDIGGQVMGPKGAEAGVWVIAESSELKTRYIKIVVTDNDGKYVIPDLPKADYRVWVRGYGLVDSVPVEAKPGAIVNHKAIVAPDAKSAAQYYPANYWYSLIEPPTASEFPGTGPTGNGIPPNIKTQQEWVAQLEEGCRYCHQLGTPVTRTLLAPGDSVEGWAERITKARDDGDLTFGNHGKANANAMKNNMARLGRSGLVALANWTDRIKAGALPKEAPPRPQGKERNVVLTIQDWGDEAFSHDVNSTDRRNPTRYANGPLYGITQWRGEIFKIDPVSGENKTFPIPGTFPETPHDIDTNPHHPTRDQKGRVWIANLQSNRPQTPAAVCSDPTNKFAAYYPVKGGRLVNMLDSATDKIVGMPVCFGSHHAAMARDADNTVFFSGDTQVMGWINTKIYDETKDAAKAQGWCPMVLDTSGDGKITPERTKWNPPQGVVTNGEGGAQTALKGGTADQAKDTQISSFLYGMNTSPVDESVWFVKYNPYWPGGVIRFTPGKNAPETCLTEYYEVPRSADGTYPAFAPRGVDIDTKKVAWVSYASGNVASFDRSKCKVVNGPAATGQQCPEGWKIYTVPGPKIADGKTNADHIYNVFVDHFDTSGLGKDTVIVPGTQSDSLISIAAGGGAMSLFRVPYPMGFYARGLDGRIDAPGADWKGRGLWSNFGTVTIAHQEGGDGETSKVVHFQFRPNPLAR